MDTSRTKDLAGDDGQESSEDARGKEEKRGDEVADISRDVGDIEAGSAVGSEGEARCLEGVDSFQRASPLMPVPPAGPKPSIKLVGNSAKRAEICAEMKEEMEWLKARAFRRAASASASTSC